MNTTDYNFSNFIARVNTLVRNENCLREKGNIEFYDTGSDSLIVCRRRSCTGGGIIIAVNLDIHNGHAFQYHVMSEAQTILSEKAETEFFRNEDIIKIKLGACGVCAMRTK